MSCTGRVALVTGAASSGMGRSIALTLAREGAQVVVNYRSIEAQAQAVVRASEEEFGGESWQVRRTTSPQDVAESVAFLRSEAGRFITGCELPLSFR